MTSQVLDLAQNLYMHIPIVDIQTKDRCESRARSCLYSARKFYELAYELGYTIEDATGGNDANDN